MGYSGIVLGGGKEGTTRHGEEGSGGKGVFCEKPME